MIYGRSTVHFLLINKYLYTENIFSLIITFSTCTDRFGTKGYLNFFFSKAIFTLKRLSIIFMFPIFMS